MRTTSTLLSSLALLAALAGVARADWRLDDSLRNFGRDQLERLEKGVRDAPQKALKRLLEEETDHIESLTEAELEEFAREAWTRLRSGREEGRLWRALREELRAAGALSGELLRKVWDEERARLGGLPERAVYTLVDQVLRNVLVERLQALRDARLEAWRIEHNLRRDEEHFRWRETPRDDGANVASSLSLPRVTLYHDEAKFREVLFEKTYTSEVGNLTVMAAGVDGLASAKVGRVGFKDEFGREVEGLGAVFSARARLTGVKADVRSKEVEAIITRDLGLRAHLSATLIDLASNVEGNLTTVVTERGLGARAEVKAGAGVSASARIPVTIDLSVLTVRVTPYASVHAGASAEAHATLDVEWAGRVRLDLGASVSSGIGFGAGVVIEIELGPALKRALDRVIKALVRAVRPVGDALMGRTWKGPPVDSGRLVLSLEDLERTWAEQPPPAPFDRGSPAAIAARYAPVIYQEVEVGERDYIRRVDFDGDWDTRNNWNRVGEGDRGSYVYYDVKETETHYFVTYSWYHPRRESQAVPPLRGLRRHENDMGGCLVVARKDAPRGREVELLVGMSGESMDHYAPSRDERLRRRHGSWNGYLRFVDEAGHPNFDLERTHLQLWVDGKDHDVHGFTGRDDRDPFQGKPGVSYFFTGVAEAPDGDRDPLVGYALRPLSELLERADDDAAFTTDDRIRPRGAVRELPRRLRGNEGPDDQAAPPWAFADALHSESHPHNESDQHRREWIEEGDMFTDPVRALSVLFRLPDDMSRTYVRNEAMGVGAPAAPAETEGLLGRMR